jgi:hypothetical protein
MYVVSAETFSTSEASSTQSTITAPATDTGHEMVARIILSEEGYAAVGANPTATVASSTRIAAGVPEFLACGPGDKVAIRDSA